MVGPGWHLVMYCPRCPKVVHPHVGKLIAVHGDLTFGDLAKRGRCQGERCRGLERRGAVLAVEPDIAPCTAAYSAWQSNRHDPRFVWQPGAPDPSLTFREAPLDVAMAGPMSIGRSAGESLARPK
jgi:hypothetical protein